LFFVLCSLFSVMEPIRHFSTEPFAFFAPS